MMMHLTKPIPSHYLFHLNLIRSIIVCCLIIMNPFILNSMQVISFLICLHVIILVLCIFVVKGIIFMIMIFIWVILNGVIIMICALMHEADNVWMSLILLLFLTRLWESCILKMDIIIYSLNLTSFLLFMNLR